MKINPFEDTIRLTNDGSLEFFFLGVGNAFSKMHFQNNLLIIKGNDHLLIDCGTLCPYAFFKYNSDISLVKNLLITHSHADHIGGLEEVALKGRYNTKTRPQMIITNEYKKILWNQSLKGGNAYGEYKDGYLKFDDYFEQIKPVKILSSPRDLFETNIGSINIKLYRTKHMPDNAKSWSKSFISYGVLIDNRILFPSDTRFDKALLNWAEKTYHPEFIFHDCQFYKGGVHASYEELKTLPDSLKNKMYLCHYSDKYSEIDAKKDGFAGFAEQGIYYSFD